MQFDLTNFLLALAVLLMIVWIITLGLMIPPRRFPRQPMPSQPGAPTPAQPDLPEPVARHFERTLGKTPPQIQSAYICGAARVNVNGLWLPLRFRGWYIPGRAFYRSLQFTWFRRPVLRGEEFFIKGVGGFKLAGQSQPGEALDQGQNLSLWAAGVWMPSLFVHDARLRWQAVDAHSAKLMVPLGAGSDEMTAHFDPLTGYMTDLTALRFRRSDNPAEPFEKIPWRVDLLEWGTYEGMELPTQIALAWGNSGSPWSYWWLEGLALNVPLPEQLQGESLLS